ncbi:hypothetical protein DFH11DRAFT_1588079 [Phellopilus nigrolimitatus]|nr:hypothetical protein DFH11DRAFT_1588079 [Phellopilus nigrolimitatus]
MYSNSRKVLILLITTLLSTTTSPIVIIAIMSQKQLIFPASFGSGVDMHMCVAIDIPGIFRFAWVAKLFHEALLCSFALYKGIQNFRRDRSPTDLMAQLVKDSVLYFFVVFAVYLLNEIVWVILGEDYTEAPIGFTMATVNIMCQGLLVNIRQQSLKRAFCITSAGECITTPSVNTAQQLSEIAWAPAAGEEEEEVL